MSATFFVPIWLWLWRDAPSTFADPEVAMRKIREIAITPRQSRKVASTSRRSTVHLCLNKAESLPNTTPACGAWPFWKHESGTFLK